MATGQMVLSFQDAAGCSGLDGQGAFDGRRRLDTDGSGLSPVDTGGDMPASDLGGMFGWRSAEPELSPSAEDAASPRRPSSLLLPLDFSAVAPDDSSSAQVNDERVQEETSLHVRPHVPGDPLCPLPESGAVDDFTVSAEKLASLSSPPSSAQLLLRRPGLTAHLEEYEDDALLRTASGGVVNEGYFELGPAPPSSTDSLVQGGACGADRRGLPEQPALVPRGDTGSEMSPWPSAGSLSSGRWGSSGSLMDTGSRALSLHCENIGCGIVSPSDRPSHGSREKMAPGSEEGVFGWRSGEPDRTTSATAASLHGFGPAPPSSTDSLVQGGACGADRRGLPEQPALVPRGDTGSEMSPWPSAGSLSSLGAVTAPMQHQKFQQVLAAPSSTDSLVQGMPSGASRRGGQPERPLLLPGGDAASEISPWPSSTSLSSTIGWTGSCCAVDSGYFEPIFPGDGMNGSELVEAVCKSAKLGAYPTASSARSHPQLCGGHLLNAAADVRCETKSPSPLLPWSDNSACNSSDCGNGWRLVYAGATKCSSGLNTVSSLNAAGACDLQCRDCAALRAALAQRTAELEFDHALILRAALAMEQREVEAAMLRSCVAVQRKQIQDLLSRLRAAEQPRQTLIAGADMTRQNSLDSVPSSHPGAQV